MVGSSHSCVALQDLRKNHSLTDRTSHLPRVPLDRCEPVYENDEFWRALRKLIPEVRFASLLLPRDVALESVAGFGAKDEELERFDLRFYQGRWEESH